MKYWMNIGSKWLPIAEQEYYRLIRIVERQRSVNKPSHYLLIEIPGKLGIHLSTGAARGIKTTPVKYSYETIRNR